VLHRRSRSYSYQAYPFPASRLLGTAIALAIISLWFAHGLAILEGHLHAPHPLESAAEIAMHVLLQAYLTTGLFITAHDAMHRTVSSSRYVNDAIGTLACLLFAGMSYRRLVVNHGRHHNMPGTEEDPDFSSSPHFIVWFVTFFARYTTLSQIVIMAALFNLLKLRYSESSIWLFWVVPSLIGSLQLFCFGTYLPHRLPHTSLMGPNRARSMPKNHALAMATCFFFGYHAEHHASPTTPWWRLAALKSKITDQRT
jgi:beta-carotene/zeaxanthin 4-ketolase